MYKIPPLIDADYDAMMFARSPEAARAAARKLVRHLLGEEALARPLEETLRECCRLLRPAPESVDESRYKDEFVELGLKPPVRHARLAA